MLADFQFLNRLLVRIAWGGMTMFIGLRVCAQNDERTRPIEVPTRAGIVAGVQGDIAVFKGIPFAAPPVGNLRWRPPEPVKPWPGVRAAREFGQVPMQSGAQRNMSEDCLYLNIWTPSTKPVRPLPVMVWIFGGGFTGGSGSGPVLDGSAFARKGVVLVTINYRVGVFGFVAHRLLTAESPQHSSGNYGLLDQIAALQWVRDNIAHFGGDPQRVTAFGESAGASSISMLLISPLAKGLFQRAILESPGALRPLPPLRDAEKIGESLGDDLAAMRAAPAAEIMKKTRDIRPAVRSLTEPRAIGPIFDGWVIPVSDEGAAFASGRANVVEMIVGSNTDEGRGFVENWPIKTVAEYQEFLTANFGASAGEAMKFYPVRRDRDVPPELSAVFMDTQFLYGVRGLARGMSQLTPNVYRYYFSHQRNGGDVAPLHGDEIEYVFGNLGRRNEAVDQPTFDAQDQALSAAMQDAWIRFAGGGDPNGEGLPRWPKYDARTDPHLEIGETISTGAGLRASKLDFVETFFRRARAEKERAP